MRIIHSAARTKAVQRLRPCGSPTPPPNTSAAFALAAHGAVTTAGAKTRCDGKLPACTSCEKAGRAAECTGASDEFARGKERCYVATLEGKIESLNARIKEARRRRLALQEDTTATPPPGQSDRSGDRRAVASSSRPVVPTRRSKKQRSEEVTAIDDLVSDFGFRSVNATARDFYGFTSAMSYPRLILSACSKESLPPGAATTLPPRHLATQLIQRYLESTFVLLPAFDEASFYTAVDNVYSLANPGAHSMNVYMVRMVLAIASAFLSERRGDARFDEGVAHVRAALQLAEDVLHPGNISGVQALVLLADYAMVDPHHFDSWGLIGAASRAMTDLGLHQDPPRGAPITRAKLELRRRVFYCINALDRSTSLVQARAFSFSDDSAQVKVPFGRSLGPAPTPTEQAGLVRSSTSSSLGWFRAGCARRIVRRWN